MRKLTQKYVENYCLEHGYRVMSPYTNAKTKIKLQNIKTGIIGWQVFSNFQQGQRFDNPKAKRKLTQEEVSIYCESQGYYLRSQYINENARIKLQNIKTEIIGYTTFGSFQKGRRFDNPKSKVKLTYQEYIHPFTNEGYTVLIDEKEYKNINSKTKIKVLCPSSHEWIVSRSVFTNVSQHNRCPICNLEKLGGISRGEQLIYSILSGNNIDFKREYSVEINGEQHRFDFYLEINDKKCFIEYDGIQHYKKSTGYFFGKLKERQRRDKVKDKYALDNGIIMVRIPYTEDTVSKVIKIMNNKIGLNLHKVKVKVGIPKNKKLTDYYLNHSREKTMKKFGVSGATIHRYFKREYGMSRRDYLKTLDK